MGYFSLGGGAQGLPGGWLTGGGAVVALGSGGEGGGGLYSYARGASI